MLGFSCNFLFLSFAEINVMTDEQVLSKTQYSLSLSVSDKNKYICVIFAVCSRDTNITEDLRSDEEPTGFLCSIRGNFRRTDVRREFERCLDTVQTRVQEAIHFVDRRIDTMTIELMQFCRMSVYRRFRRAIWEKHVTKIRLHNLEADLELHSYTMKMNHFGDLVGWWSCWWSTPWGLCLDSWRIQESNERIKRACGWNEIRSTSFSRPDECGYSWHGW